MDSAIAQDIEMAIKELVDDIAPDVRYLPKYGGEVLATDPQDDGKFVGGIFAFKNHVSLEFSDGADFDDLSGHLEGKGKRRRHLKLMTVDDVSRKDARSFLAQALSR